MAEFAYHAGTAADAGNAVDADSVESALLDKNGVQSDATINDSTHVNSPRLQPMIPRFVGGFIATLVVVLLWSIGRAESAPLAPLPCDGVRVSHQCWQLSAGGQSCMDLCGSDSAVDLEATVRGSGSAVVQAALAEEESSSGHDGAPPWASSASISDCGVDDPHFPYGGMALLNASGAWTCASAEQGTFRVVPSADHRSPCVCTSVPVERPLVNLMEGLLVGLVLVAVVLLPAAAADAVGKRRHGGGEGSEGDAQEQGGTVGVCAALTASLVARDFATALGLVAELVVGRDVHDAEKTTKLQGFDHVGLLVGSFAVMLDFYTGACSAPILGSHRLHNPVETETDPSATPSTPSSPVSSLTTLIPRTRPFLWRVADVFVTVQYATSTRGMGDGASSSLRSLCSCLRQIAAP